MPTLTVDGSTEDGVSTAPQVVMVAGGTWGGGTLTLQTYGDDDAWHSTSETLTADGSVTFPNAGNNRFRANLTGSTSPSLWVEVR
jgi:hypothetical protein